MIQSPAPMPYPPQSITDERPHRHTKLITYPKHAVLMYIQVWLSIPDRVQHDAVADACISVALFNAYRAVQWDPMRMYQMQMAMIQTPRQPSFSATHPSIDGCW